MGDDGLLDATGGDDCEDVEIFLGSSGDGIHWRPNPVFVNKPSTCEKKYI